MTQGVADGDHEWVAPGYREQVSIQSYGAEASIEGIRIINLRLFSDEGGDFCEITRLAHGAFGQLTEFCPLQINYSLMEPGTIKAWHLHRCQDEAWFVPPSGRLLVGLLDTRANSATLQAAMRFILGAGTPRLLFIPHGVAHGVANLSPRTATMLYFASEVFDPEKPDEHRLPHDLLGDGFWTIRPG